MVCLCSGCEHVVALRKAPGEDERAPDDPDAEEGDTADALLGDANGDHKLCPTQ